jgi:hypothetical protein
MSVAARPAALGASFVPISRPGSGTGSIASARGGNILDGAGLRLQCRLHAVDGDTGRERHGDATWTGQHTAAVGGGLLDGRRRSPLNPAARLLSAYRTAIRRRVGRRFRSHLLAPAQRSAAVSQVVCLPGQLTTFGFGFMTRCVHTERRSKSSSKSPPKITAARPGISGIVIACLGC